MSRLVSQVVRAVFLLLVSIPTGSATADDGQLAWPGWRGANRDGIGDPLPVKLPSEVDFVWTHESEADGLGGIAATNKFVLFAGRDQLDTKDVITCLRLADGQVVWQHDYAALPPADAEVRDGKLDYGNSPRTTPLVIGNRVVTLGAMGDLYCLDLNSGKVNWTLNYVLDFDASIPTWGWSGSPVHHDGLIIFQPGATESAIVAVRLDDGQVEWEAPGGRAAYTSPIIAQIAGKSQIVTCDASFWFGFEAKTGKQLWRLKPERSGEFHVPTALVAGERLMIVGEVNGGRLYGFDKSGKLDPQATSIQINFAPDTHSPVKIGASVVGVHNGLWIMSADNLQQAQEIEQSEFGGHCSIIGDGKRFMVLTDSAMLFLYELVDAKLKSLGQLKLIDRGGKIYAHPAWVDGYLIFREGSRVHCVKLK